MSYLNHTADSKVKCSGLGNNPEKSKRTEFMSYVQL